MQRCTSGCIKGDHVLDAANPLRAYLEALGIIPGVAHAPVELGAPILPEKGRHVIYKQGSALYQALLGA